MFRRANVSRGLRVVHLACGWLSSHFLVRIKIRFKNAPYLQALTV